MAHYKVKDGRVSGHVMSEASDFLPKGDKASATDLAMDHGANFTPLLSPIMHPAEGAVALEAEQIKARRGERTRGMYYSVWNESIVGKSAVLLNPSVSDTYAATPYMQTMQMIEEVFPCSAVGFSNINDGQRIMLIIELTGSIDLGDGDVLIPNLVVIDSLDGSHATKIIPTAHRSFCENQLRHSKIILSVKHTANHNRLLSQWTTQVARAKQDWALFVDRAKSFKHIDFDRRGYAVSWLHEVLPKPERGEKQSAQGYRSQLTRWENDIDSIMRRYDYEAREFGHNAWSLLQAIQSHEYHTKTKGDADKKANAIIDPESKQKLTLRMEAIAHRHVYQSL